MIALPEVLAVVARESGMKVPEDLNNYDKDEFPHWHVYLTLQLGAPMPHPSAHWDNAKVIAKIPPNQIRKISMKNIMERGFAIGYEKR